MIRLALTIAHPLHDLIGLIGVIRPEDGGDGGCGCGCTDRGGNGAE
jgi:hypothetical protein